MTTLSKGVFLLFSCSLSLTAAQQIELGSIEVEAKADTEVIEDVSGEEIKSADLGEALFKSSPSVSLVRRSGISNDIIVRGQKKDNINVTIDGAKVYGACPNRMDPPISHIVTNNVDSIEINEGPYNVEDFGVLSGDVKIHTVKPSKELSGEVGVNAGSWGYKKAYINVSGGTNTVRVMVSASTETGKQYKDGNGNTFAEQQDVYIAENLTGDMTHDNKLKSLAYLPQYSDMDAFTKKTFSTKLFWDIAENHELQLGYTANRSDNILYPNTPMDAEYDDSDIFTLKYIAKNLGVYSKKLTLDLYRSEVDHPMSNRYRVSSGTTLKTHHLTTEVQGAKLKNEFNLGDHALTIGLDYSLRNWDGKMLPMNMPTIQDADTKNTALFMSDKLTIGEWVLDLGARYDYTETSTERATMHDNDYSALNGYLLAAYQADKKTKYFAGIGSSTRVPDPRELYYVMGSTIYGDPDLKIVRNNEIDLGVEYSNGNTKVKAKAFYSNLQDFIVYNAGVKKFENVDASIWGLEFSGTYVVSDSLYVDYGVAYQRGKKEHPLTGQTSTNLPEIPPVKLNLAANYDYDDSLSFKAEVIAAGEWNDVDTDNGEQPLDAYAVLNLKATKTFAQGFELALGVDNVFDATYAVSNTYADLTLITGGDEVMLMNEPGRYFYLDFKYTF